MGQRRALGVILFNIRRCINRIGSLIRNSVEDHHGISFDPYVPSPERSFPNVRALPGTNGPRRTRHYPYRHKSV